MTKHFFFSPLFTVAAIAAALALPAVPAGAVDDTGTSSMAAMHQAWMKAAAPGPEHKLLAAAAGEWDTRISHWMAPGTPPAQATGRATLRMILDGRFLEEQTESEMMGMPFHGVGLVGYDNLKQKFTSSWADNASTAIFTMLGDCTPDHATCRYQGKFDDPATGKAQTMRMVVTAPDPDKRIAEFFAPGPGGQEFKVMEVVYTRRR